MEIKITADMPHVCTALSLSHSVAHQQLPVQHPSDLVTPEAYLVESDPKLSL